MGTRNCTCNIIRKQYNKSYVVTKCWIPFAICSIQIQADSPTYEGVSAH